MGNQEPEKRLEGNTEERLEGKTEERLEEKQKTRLDVKTKENPETKSSEKADDSVFLPGEGDRQHASLYSLMRVCGRYLYRRYGNGFGQGRILVILSRCESMTQRELQDLLHVQSGSLSEILTKMEDKGLIVRRRDGEDKRRSVLVLTEEGRCGAEDAIVRCQEKKKLFEALTPQEREELKRLLNKLLDDWEQ